MNNIPLFLIDIDLVNYSTISGTNQNYFFEGFQKQVKNILEELNILNSIKIPTGDGMFIGLDAKDIKDCFIKCIIFIIKLSDWAKDNSYEFRTALNYGTASIIKDINNQDNLVGNLINDTARIISAGQAGAIIIHENVYKECFRKDSITLGSYAFSIIDGATVLDKHNFSHPVYSILVNNKYGNKDKIKLNYITTLEAPDFSKNNNFQSDFLNKTKNASELTFYGIYHPNVWRVLNNLDVTDGRSIKINIIYAGNKLRKKIANFFCSDQYMLSFDNKSGSIQDIKDWYRNLPYGNNVQINIFEYYTLPTFGAAFIDSNLPGKGFIHISNYLEDVIPSETPYFELFYKTDKMPFLYKFYYDYYNEKIRPNLKRILHL